MKITAENYFNYIKILNLRTKTTLKIHKHYINPLEERLIDINLIKIRSKMEN